MYAQSQAEAQASANPQGGSGKAGGASEGNEEKVVDAEFTEVKDKK